MEHSPVLNIGKFKIINQTSIAAGIRRVEALRDKQLQDYLSQKDKLSSLSSQKDEETIKMLQKIEDDHFRSMVYKKKHRTTTKIFLFSE